MVAWNVWGALAGGGAMQRARVMAIAGCLARRGSAACVPQQLLLLLAAGPKGDDGADTGNTACGSQSSRPRGQCLGPAHATPAAI